jgi:hypothetical protein
LQIVRLLLGRQKTLIKNVHDQGPWLGGVRRGHHIAGGR